VGDEVHEVQALAAKRGIPRTALLATLLLTAAGCESLHMNQGRLTSIFAAAQTGAFKRDRGAWPTGIDELIGHACPALDVDEGFTIDAPPPPPGECQFFATLPYRLRLSPRNEDLQMELRDGAGTLVCRLFISVPAESAHALVPRVELRTTLFTCPGEGEPW